MRRPIRPKLIAALLAIGILVLTAGAIIAATGPNWRLAPSVPRSARPAAAANPKGALRSKGRAAAAAVLVASGVRAFTAAAYTTRPLAPGTSSGKSITGASESNPSTPTSATKLRPVTYTVKAGDTLLGIAEWFKQHGYEGVYRANRTIIGRDPNLIVPGQRITIARGVMRFGTTRHSRGGA